VVESEGTKGNYEEKSYTHFASSKQGKGPTELGIGEEAEPW